eukprot:3500117-Pyramimonas_sp.AAC.3
MSLMLPFAGSACVLSVGNSKTKESSVLILRFCQRSCASSPCGCVSRKRMGWGGSGYEIAHALLLVT